MDGQFAELKAAGAEKVYSEKVYSEKDSGAKTERRELRRAIEKLQTGDVLVVSRDSTDWPAQLATC